MEESLSTNYKMYKSGKRWITASLVTGVVSMGMFAGSQIVNADSVSAAPVSATPVSATPVSATPVNEAPVSATPVSEAPVSATPVSATPVSATPVSATPVSATPVSATPVSATPVSEAPVSAAPVSATPVSATPVSEAPVSATPVSATPVSATPVSATPVSATQSRLKDSSAFTNVTPDNFEDYFTSNGSAKYDKPSGTVTITPDEKDKVGSFSLDSKIDMSSSFTLSGSVNLGSHTQQYGGADGIGFAFHNGNTTDLGNAGGNLGIGGLQDAIGFKLDTYHNDYRVPQTSTAGAEIANTDSNGYGWDTDPSKNDYPQFGSFVTTSDQQIKAKDGNNYQRWWATTDTNSAQKLDDADLDGKFHKFVVAYDGDSRTLTINYTQTDDSILTWSKIIPDTYKAMALTVSASTGGSKNLQQFKLDSFEFTQAATVNVKYVDTTGKQIAQGLVNYPNKPAVNGTYSTEQLDIPGYKFVKMDDGSATGNPSISPNGTLTDPGDNGTVVYVYAPAYTQATQTVNETIHYVDQQGQTVSADHSATPINFVTVTNPVDQSTKTYVSTTASSATLDDNGVPTGNDWQEATNGKFSAVMNPTISGYHVISTTDPANDLTTTTEQTVNGNSQDLEFTVVYAPAYTQATQTVNETIHYVDQQGQTVSADHSATPINFVTVTNPVDQSTKTYVSTTASSATLDDNGVPTGNDWQEATNGKFSAVMNPTISGYHVISTTDPANDLTTTTEQTVNGNSQDLEFTVVYAPNETPSSETPSSETPSSETPSSETPSSETPSSETPSSETPSSETPSSEVPSSETPSSETPSSETPSSETPSSEVPSSETPSSETPSSETPSSETPSSETPISEVPSSPTVNVSYKVTNKNNKKLPDTGENKNNHTDAIAAALITSILGITAVARKKKGDN